MYALHFGEEPPQRRSVEQLRGIEGARVRETYKRIAAKYGVEWKARNYDTSDWDKGDLPNRCLSSATACLYGVTEAAVLAAGYAPAIGFIHTGNRNKHGIRQQGNCVPRSRGDEPLQPTGGLFAPPLVELPPAAVFKNWGNYPPPELLSRHFENQDVVVDYSATLFVEKSL